MTTARLAALEATNERRRARTSARIEDFEFLIGSGVPHEDAALRAGWPTLHAAERSLYRNGRPDLARPLACIRGATYRAVRRAA